jgi:hypothetical protein
MITKVPLEDSRDGRLRKANERTLLWIEAQAGLNEPRIGNLDEILLILSSVEELSG